MKKLRNFIFNFQNQIFFSFVAASGVLGLYVGYVTVDQYETIVNATLGFTVLYLLHQRFVSPKTNIRQSAGIRLEFPKDLKYLIYAFALTIIMFWAGVQIIHLFGI